MPCSKEETLARLFYNASSSFLLLLLLLYYSIIFLLKLLHFIGSYPLIQRNQNDYDYIFSEEEEEEEEVEYHHHKYFHVESSADSISFVPNKNNYEYCEGLPAETVLHDPVIEELQDGSFGDSSSGDEKFSSAIDDDDDLSPSSERVQDDADVVEQEIPERYADSLHIFVQNQGCPTLSTSIDHQQKSGFVDNDKSRDSMMP